MRSGPAAVLLWTCVLVGYGIGFTFGGPVVRGALLLSVIVVILGIVVWLVDTLKKDRE